jgi:DNA-binding response OmpR family regulator
MTRLVYFADNDPSACETAKEMLEKAGCKVECFADSAQLYEVFLQKPCHLAVLGADAVNNQAFMTGVKIKQFHSLPVIILAAEESDEDYVFSISLGIDAYLSKPLHPAKLLAHVRALLIKTDIHSAAQGMPLPMTLAGTPLDSPAGHHASQAQVPPQAPGHTLSHGDISICNNRLMAFCDNQVLALTKTEFKMLSFILTHYHRAVSRNELIDNIWGSGHTIGTRATDDVIKRLRQKLNAARSKVSIDTVWGYGFRLGASALA